ncbi:POZ domain-containing protein [Chaetoceros tenuissimus]|uniref:POZ domain-containing protein n=1 Tax=Chaetoceros tenuissimus TaxID=426638 RepID=A0AAD3D8M0_9STRA|nr:POZ domain-containing protein [Chaetoceros tenuissimus]
MSTTHTTITLNVGGTTYQVSKTLLEKFPGSLLERCASNTWNKGGEEVFIEGDGTRFRQVLDYMRHGEVTLPRGESTPSFLKELEYYGIEYDEDKIMNRDEMFKTSFLSMLPRIKLLGIPLFVQVKTLKFMTGDYIFTLVLVNDEVQQLKAKHMDDSFALEISELLDSYRSQNTTLEELAPNITTQAEASAAIAAAFSVGLASNETVYIYYAIPTMLFIKL